MYPGQLAGTPWESAAPQELPVSLSLAKHLQPRLAANDGALVQALWLLFEGRRAQIGARSHSGCTGEH